MGFEGLAPSVFPLLAGLLLDAVFGDPQIRLHPIRLVGVTLTLLEGLLRRLGLDGYAGGCLLFLLLASVWVALPSALLYGLAEWSKPTGLAAHAIVVFVLLALRDLVDHVLRVERAIQRSDVPGARAAVALFVGRDTERMDAAACRRAAIESLAEGFVDGFLSALFWYVVGGLPGLLLFKVVSTMDSMVGYRTPRYQRFGWCGARLDDVMNFVPARLAWAVLSVSALPLRTLSAAKGLRLGLEQHSVIPGPNAGWSEATMAGVLQRRLVGPVWKSGALVTEIWLGEPSDPEGGREEDVTRALRVTILASCGTALASLILVQYLW